MVWLPLFPKLSRLRSRVPRPHRARQYKTLIHIFYLWVPVLRLSQIHPIRCLWRTIPLLVCRCRLRHRRHRFLHHYQHNLYKKALRDRVQKFMPILLVLQRKRWEKGRLLSLRMLISQPSHSPNAFVQRTRVLAQRLRYIVQLTILAIFLL